MRFIRLLLANQIACIFRSNDNTRYHNFFFNNSIYKTCQTLLHVNIDKEGVGFFSVYLTFCHTIMFMIVVVRRNHLIRMAESINKIESIKTKQCIVTFLKIEKFVLLCLSNQIYCSKKLSP